MKKNLLAFILMSFGVTACSYIPLPGNYSDNSPPKVSSEWKEYKTGTLGDGPIAKTAEKSMDSLDKSKMLRALDKPLGKSTEWENVSTGYKYTVTPIAKLKVQENPFCRTYTIVVTKGERKQEINGTACVGDDANWHPVN